MDRFITVHGPNKAPTQVNVDHIDRFMASSDGDKDYPGVVVIKSRGMKVTETADEIEEMIRRAR